MKQLEDFSKQWRALQMYVACMQNVIEIWRKFFLESFQSDYFSQSHLQAFLNRIDVSIGVLLNRYAFDTLNALHVNVNASGFPQAYDVRLSSTQYYKLINGEERVVDVEGLKKEYIDYIVAHKKINYSFLERIAKAQVQAILLNNNPLEVFKITDISKMDALNGSNAYLCVWERFDSRNIPSIYAMIVEYSGELIDPGKLKDFALVLREETNYMPKLDRLGNSIDYAFANVHPKWIGRLILGPVFISGVTQAEHLLQKTLDRAYDGGQYIAASRIIFEYVLSSGQKPMQALFDPQGNRHKVLQEWGVRSSDQECYNRGVSHVEKFLFAPHDIVQMLDEDYRKEIGHKIVGG